MKNVSMQDLKSIAGASQPTEGCVPNDDGVYYDHYTGKPMMDFRKAHNITDPYVATPCVMVPVRFDKDTCSYVAC